MSFSIIGSSVAGSDRLWVGRLKKFCGGCFGFSDGLLQHVHHQADERFFLFRVGFGDQRGQGGQAGVVDDGLAARVEQAPVSVQRINE
nr:hypothetical protein [Neisseria chenwenguii]